MKNRQGTAVPAVEVKRLTKEFPGTQALKQCSLSVEPGEIYGIVGANGAGKTTLLKLIAGFLEPTEGSAQVMGLSIQEQRHQALRQLGCLIEVPCFYEHLDARENLWIPLSYLYLEEPGKKDFSAQIGWALSKVGLEGTGSKPVSQFSLGMRQRLGIARAIVHKPKVLLLDEPVNGLDPASIREMRELFLSLAKEGMTLLISSHILSELALTAGRVAIIREGSMVEEANMAALIQEHPNDLEDYLIQKMNGGSSALC